MRKFLPLLLVFLLFAPVPVLAGRRTSSSGRRSHSSRAPRVSPSRAHAVKTPRSATKRSPAVKCIGCERDNHGRIKRSASARNSFTRSHPCPATGKASGPCPGYVIDHVKPLKRGGADTPSNMQWQTKAQAKAKDRIE